MFLRLLRFRGENRIAEQTRETRHGRQRAARQSLEEKPAMQPMLVRAAYAGGYGLWFGHWFQSGGRFAQWSILLAVYLKSINRRDRSCAGVKAQERCLGDRV